MAAPAEPPLRATVKVTLPALCATLSFAAEKASEPVGAAPLPAMVTVAFTGVPSVAPLLPLKATVKDLLPMKAVLFNGTVKVFVAASPSAHVNVPFTAV